MKIAGIGTPKVPALQLGKAKCGVDCSVTIVSFTDRIHQHKAVTHVLANHAYAGYRGYTAGHCDVKDYKRTDVKEQPGREATYVTALLVWVNLARESDVCVCR
jgi:hypothetical protein